jgi:hypothetical protein
MEKTKQGKNSKEKGKRPIMVAEGGDRCPVATYKKYLSLLNPTFDRLFPQPTRNWKPSLPRYSCMARGKNHLGGVMRELSEEAGLSQIYTNHCVRATVCTMLDAEGVPAREIMDVTGHKSVSSLDHYINKTSLKRKAEMSKILHSHTAGNTKGPSSPVASTSHANGGGIMPSAMICNPKSPIIPMNVSQAMSLSRNVTRKLATIFPGANIENIQNFHLHFHNQ